MKIAANALGLWACALMIGLVPCALADDPKPLPKELAWIPADSAGVVHVRFAELWNSAFGKNVVKLINAIEPKTLLEIEQQLGLSLSRIDRVTVVLSSVNERNPFEMCAIRITTTKPYDRRDVLAGMRIEADKRRNAADTDLFPLHDRGMLHFSDEKNITLVPRTEGAFALLGGMLSQSKTGALRTGLGLAAESNQVVLSFDITKFPRVPVDEIPPEIKPLRPLLDAKTVTVIGNLVGENANFELRLTFAGKEDAADGKQALEAGIKLAQEFLDDREREMNRSNSPKVALEVVKEIRASLTTVKVEQKDATVTATTQVKVSQIVERVLADGATSIRVARDRITSQNNLKQINLALINYADAYQGVMPPAAIADKNGKPLLSWRVTILPYIEEDVLYKQFKLDEPWDSEHNVKLIQKMPKVYMLPGDKRKHDQPSTYYQAFVGPHAAFEPNQKIRYPASFTDGTANTIMIGEAEDAVPWTKPDDIVYDPKKMPKVGFHFGERCNVGFADGSVRALKKKLDEKIWHLLIQRDDGQVIPNFDD